METHGRSRVAREEWAKRVERWRDSGLTCAEFAAEIGVNPRTLTYWKWALGKEARGEKRRTLVSRTPRPRAGRAATMAAEQPVLPAFVEVHATTRDARFELELGAGRRLRVPANFDASELRRLIAAVEAP
jgi:hypothetical protein